MDRLSVSNDRWAEIRGRTVESRFELAEPLQIGVANAIFRALDCGAAQREVFVILEEATERYAEDHFNRYREASFLAHPNLTRVFETGRTQIEGESYIYAVTETAESSLSDFTRQKALGVAEARELTMQLIAALAYLHSENLVYCALRPESVWRAGTQWKLADYGQLRIPGINQDTRRLLTNLNYDSPPEAYDGIVTPAWDVWSLASVLQRTLHAGPLPAPFDEIARDSLVPDPASRLTLPRIAELLSGRVSSEPPAPSEPVTVPSTMPPSLSFGYTIAARAENPALPEEAAMSARKRAHWSVPLQSCVIAIIAALTGAILTAVVHCPRRIAVTDVDATRGVSATAHIEGIQTRTRQSDRRAIANTARPQVAAEPSEIFSLLDKWVRSTRNRDVAEQVSCYAPLVETYFGEHGLTLERLRHEKERAFSLVGAVKRFDIDNIHLRRITPDRAVVSFDKYWAFGSGKQFAGSVREELALGDVRGEWKIVAERETRIYWVTRRAASGSL